MIEISPEQRAALLSPTATASVGSPSVADAFGGPQVLTKIREKFEAEGYVHVRGLLGSELMTGLEEAAQNSVDKSEARGFSFRTMEFGPVFAAARPPSRSPGADEKKYHEGSSSLESKQYFREVALSSAVPRFIAAVLLDLPPSTSLRVLKDAFLAKAEEDQHCGWHVDDLGFWPCKAADPSPGINAWIALDDIPAATGGGMAVSPGSHKAEWRWEAYKIIGSTQTYPEGGFQSVEEMMENARPQTCNMIEEGAEMNATIEATKVLPDYRRGDVLLCKRWLFHRSEPVNKAGQQHLRDMESARPGRTAAFKRYSVRYELGSSRLLEGFSLEAPVLLNPENAGQTLDRVCAEEGPFYPRCWPAVDVQEMDGIKDLAENKFPAADKIKSKFVGKLFAPKRKENQSTMGN